MGWTVSAGPAVVLLVLCWGHQAVYSGTKLSPNGFHLCPRNESRNVSLLVVRVVPQTVTRLCGGWLPLTTCTVTVSTMVHRTEFKAVTEQVSGCCDGFVQAGRYCALAVNSSREVTAKPGSCPSAGGGSPGSEECDLDVDCPGWQRCCQQRQGLVCSDPTSVTSNSERGGGRLNVTVTVKTDYRQLMSEKKKGLLSHLRILHAMVSGALQSEAVICFLSCFPVPPYRSATSLLVDYGPALSLLNATARLHLLLRHVDEVSSVTVQDIDECAHAALNQCPSQSDCTNTMGSFQCVCPQGHTDPNNPGANCSASVGVWATTAHLLTLNASMSPYTDSASTRDPERITAGVLDTTGNNMTTALASSSLSSSSTPQISSGSSVAPPSTTPCVSSLWATNVTGTSFSVIWSSPPQDKLTFLVVVSNRSDAVVSVETNQSRMAVTGLQPGLLYNVSVSSSVCGNHGPTSNTRVRTDAQTVDVSARVTNMQFTADMQNPSSQIYKDLHQGISDEIYMSLSDDIKAMVDSGQLTIVITSFSSGSLVVNFRLIYSPIESQDISFSAVSTAMLQSLKDSRNYTVDEDNTRVNDFNECESGNNDCSQEATCINTWGSYTCECDHGFTDKTQERPGRLCQATTPRTIQAQTTTAQTIKAPPPPTTTNAVQTTTVAGDTTPIDLIKNNAPSRTSTSMAPITLAISHTTARTSSPTTIGTTSSPTTTATTTSSPKTIGTTTSSSTTTATRTSYPTTTATTTSSPTTIGTTISSSTTTATTTSYPTTTATTTSYPTTISATTSSPTTTATITSSPTTIGTTTSSSTTTATTTSSPTTIGTTISSSTTTATTTTSSLTTIGATTSYPTTTATTTSSSTSLGTTTSSPTTLGTTTSYSTTTIVPPLTTTASPESLLEDISVECRDAAITVTVAKRSLRNANILDTALFLGSTDCRVNGGNDTHVQLTVGWNECATNFVQNETYYTTSVTLYNSMETHTPANGEGEKPKAKLEVPIMCTWMKGMLISTDLFSAGYDMIQEVITGFGSFQVMVQLMNGTMPLPQNYSLSSKEAVVLEVRLNTSSELIKLIINKCWITASRNSLDVNSYTFLENSCALNVFTNVLVNGNSSTSRISVQIFSLVSLEVIYLHCQVHICLQTGSDTCLPNCQDQRAARSGKIIGRTFGSFGPIYKEGEEPLEDSFDVAHVAGFSCLGVGLMLFFIIAFVVFFYYQRNRIGHYNFSNKPKEENFTYLVFNK